MNEPAHKVDDLAVEIINQSGEVVPLSRRYLGNGRLTAIGLELPEGLPFGEWAAIGDALSMFERASMWAIGDWWVYGEKQEYGDRSKLLEMLRESGYNPPSFKACANAGSLVRRFATSRRREVLSFGHHDAVAKLDDQDAAWFLERAEVNGWPRQELRDEVRRFKLERVRRPGEQKYETQTVEDLVALVEQGRRFGTIYADPPWPYGNQATRASTRKHYKDQGKGKYDSRGMTLEQIAALPVADLTADAAHCHLWTTNGFLREAFDIMSAWGFTYKSCFIWVKPDFGIGNYWRVGHEFMLFGIKGKAPFADNSQQSWIYEQAGEHSVKPPKVRGIIERCSPGPYLELFARREIENWTVWGNEVERRSDRAGLFAEDQSE